MELKVRGGKNNKISTRYFSQKATLITLVLRPHHESPNTQKTSSKTKVYADITKIAHEILLFQFSLALLSRPQLKKSITVMLFRF